MWSCFAPPSQLGTPLVWNPSPAQVASRLFSAQELSALRRDATFRRQIDEGLVLEVEPIHASSEQSSWVSLTRRRELREADPIAGGLRDRTAVKWAEVSWRSVSLARRERRLTDDSFTPATSFTFSEKQCLTEAANSSAERRMDEVVIDARIDSPEHQGASCIARQTEASAMRQHARQREDKISAGGAQNFYKAVRVCDTCFQVRAERLSSWRCEYDDKSCIATSSVHHRLKFLIVLSPRRLNSTSLAFDMVSKLIVLAIPTSRVD